MDGIQVAWKAEPLTAERRTAQHAEILSFHARERRSLRSFSRTGWVVAAVLGMIATAEAVTIAYHQITDHPTPPQFVEVDTSTGWVGLAVGARDAPKLFGQRVAMKYLRDYIEARESYLPERDQAQWQQVRAMSSADEMANYIAWRRSDIAPVKQLGATGHVDAFNFTGDLHPIQSTDGTWTYTVRFDRREVKQEAVGPVRHWVATVAFQWHPEMTMSTEDSQINPAGMQVIAYSAKEQ